ncbi:hypothetical protein EDC01DRAFT_611462 [Geopyxis carbonaria]|nr:hypothetical protein EDC01DRAFT_611462 [Geopyxis carbonaria]
MGTLPPTPLFEALHAHAPGATAITHAGSGKTFTYGALLRDVAALRPRLPADEKRVAILAENSYEYVVGLLGVMAAGAVAVPLCTAHPVAEQKYVIEHAGPTMLLATQKFRERAGELAVGAKDMTVLELPDHPASNSNTAEPEKTTLTAPAPADRTGSLIIYTSGTTGRPKGALHTHASLTAQTTSLRTAWGLSAHDRLLHVLPLHHIHGIIAALLTPLTAGSAIEFLYPFAPAPVWAALEHSTVLMAVPTIYSRLLAHAPPTAATTVAALRLAISGSAALPAPVRTGWAALGGDLLERYGMTETGLTLSHTLQSRPPNSVGWPLPGVEARLGADAEIQVRGPTLFREYFRNPAATAAEFTPDGWFRTGDIGRIDEAGAYCIEGRRSVDIIKTGGEKVSALEVERVMLGLPAVQEVAVVALEGGEWGQRVAAVVVLAPGVTEAQWGLAEMRREMKEVAANYKVPTVMRVVPEMPRNVMGKVNKRELVRTVFGEDAKK